MLLVDSVEVKHGLPHIWQHKHILHMQPVGSCVPPVALFMEAPLHHIKKKLFTL